MLWSFRGLDVSSPRVFCTWVHYYCATGSLYVYVEPDMMWVLSRLWCDCHEACNVIVQSDCCQGRCLLAVKIASGASLLYLKIPWGAFVFPDNLCLGACRGCHLCTANFTAALVYSFTSPSLPTRSARAAWQQILGDTVLSCFATYSASLLLYMLS